MRRAPLLVAYLPRWQRAASPQRSCPEGPWGGVARTRPVPSGAGALPGAPRAFAVPAERALVLLVLVALCVGGCKRSCRTAGSSRCRRLLVQGLRACCQSRASKRVLSRAPCHQCPSAVSGCLPSLILNSITAAAEKLPFDTNKILAGVKPSPVQTRRSGAASAWPARMLQGFPCLCPPRWPGWCQPQGH